MSAPVVPDGELPRCLWCEREERNTGRSRVCYHGPGDPVDRAAWFEREQARRSA